jgi:hypothetical protein
MLRGTPFAVLGLALAAAAPAAAAADLIVVEARGVAYKPGQKIDDTKKLTLADGQKVKLVAANGRMLNLVGPYDEVPSAEGTSEDTLTKATALLEAMKVQKAARLTEIGTVRDPGVDLPDPWLLNADGGGSVCVREGQPLVFWRKNASIAETFVLTPSDRSWSARYTWPAGQDRLEMPRLFPLRDKGTFVIELGGKPVAITFNIIPASVPNDAVRAAWMSAKDCAVQAGLLAKTVNQPSGG